MIRTFGCKVSNSTSSGKFVPIAHIGRLCEKYHSVGEMDAIEALRALSGGGNVSGRFYGVRLVSGGKVRMK